MYRVRDITEERTRTLYVRLPHTIRNPKEVQELFNENAIVKLPRQSSRACHVIFPSVEEKVKGLENVKTKTIDGKRVIAFNPRLKPLDNKVSRKKIVVPKPKPEPKITKTLFVSNLPKSSRKEDVQKAFPGSTSVTMLELNSRGLRSAFVKMDSLQTAGEYIKREKERPVIFGHHVFIQPDTRSSKPRKSKKTNKIRVYGEDGKPNNNKFENLSTKKTVKEVEERSSESEDDDEADEEQEEEEVEEEEAEAESD